MKVKSLKNFVGKVCMCIGDIKDVDDTVASDLIACGFAEAVDVVKATPAKVKGEKKHESKRDNA